MAIELNGKTKLTTEVEKLFIELGGGDPNKTLTREELSEALVNALNALPEDSSILKKLCNHFYSEGALTNICSEKMLPNDWQDLICRSLE